MTREKERKLYFMEERRGVLVSRVRSAKDSKTTTDAAEEMEGKNTHTRTVWRDSQLTDYQNKFHLAQ
jgi:hypothetical protein